MINFWQNSIYLYPIIILFITIILNCFIIIKNRNFLYSYIVTLLGILISLIFLNSFLFFKQSLIYFSKFRDIDIFLINILLLSSFFTILYSYFWIKKNFFQKEEFYLLILLSLIGGYIAILSMDLVSIFLAIELFSISILGLLSYLSLKKTKIFEISLKYFLMSSISSIIFLCGICLLYFSFNTFSLEHRNFLTYIELIYPSIQYIGIFCIIFSLFSKISFFPFHFLLIEIYNNIPSIVLMYYSIVVKIVYLSILFKIFDFLNFKNIFFLVNIISLFSIFSMLYGSYLIIFQKNIKKILAYSSIISSGYIGTIFILFYHDFLFEKCVKFYFIDLLLNNIVLFGSFIILENLFLKYSKLNLKKIDFYKGFFWNFPIIGFSIILGFLSLSAFPFTLGFISKFYLILFILIKKKFFIGLCMLISGIINIFFYIRLIIKLLFLNKNLNHKKIFKNRNKKLFFLEFLTLFLSVFILILSNFSRFFFNNI